MDQWTNVPLKELRSLLGRQKYFPSKGASPYKGWKKSSLENCIGKHKKELRRWGVSHYTAIEIIEDDDVEALFGIYDSIELYTGPELYITFQRFASSSTQSQPTSLLSFHYEQSQQVSPSYDHQSQLLFHQAPHPLTLYLNEPTHQHIRDWEYQSHSYTELLWSICQPRRTPKRTTPSTTTTRASSCWSILLVRMKMTSLQLWMMIREKICPYNRQTFNHMNITYLMSHPSTFYTF